MKQRLLYPTLITAILLISTITTRSYAQAMVDTKLEGRWDLTIQKDGKELPSWLEVMHSGRSTLFGRFVYAFGSARPISQVKPLGGGKYSFAIPVQWEPGNTDMAFEITLLDSTHMKGTMLYTDGKTYEWTGVRAPSLTRKSEPVWGEPIKLFNGLNMKGWHTTGENQWITEGGVIKSPKSGSNLVSDKTFTDFKLHIEFRYPKGSNSGVYLRGRYEVQVEDSYGEEPLLDRFSSIYGFLVPNEMSIKKPGEWQSFDITLVGRTVTVVSNGKPVIIKQVIPGITGGAIDSKEGEPGPIYIQGDHGPVEYRNIVITPAK